MERHERELLREWQSLAERHAAAFADTVARVHNNAHEVQQRMLDLIGTNRDSMQAAVELIEMGEPEIAAGMLRIHVTSVERLIGGDSQAKQ